MGLFYEIISRDGRKNYLWGTMHTNGKTVTALPPEVVAAIEGAECFIFEADVTVPSGNKYYSTFSNWHDKTKEVLDKSVTTDFDLAVWYGHDTPISFYSKSVIQKLSHHFSDPMPMDKQLIAKLESQKRRSILYLETFDEQRIAFEGLKFDYAQQMEFYEYMSKQPEPIIENLEALYLQENIVQITKEANPFWENENNGVPKCVCEYHADLIQNRDVGLADGLQFHFEKGNVFAAIGAAHLIGVTQSLRHKGFTINPITLGPRITPITALFEEEGTISQNPNNFWLGLPSGQNQDPSLISSTECKTQ